MSIDWSKDAVEAALVAWWKKPTPEGGHCGAQEMREALNAAINIQGVQKDAYYAGYGWGKFIGKNEALAQVREQADGKIYGLEADLDSALDILWRRGDDGARQWVTMNYPKFAAAKN